MKKKKFFLVSSLFFVCLALTAQTVENRKIPQGGALLKIEIEENGDTIFLAQIQNLNIFPRANYSNKSTEQFYWKTVRDVKKALPLAKIVGEEMARTNRILASMKNDKERKQYLNDFEKQLVKTYEPVLRNMTKSQGLILLKLINRECQTTSYDLIQMYKGSFSAFFWQGIARIFGANLKIEYDVEGEDKQIERIIELVEAGQL